MQPTDKPFLRAADFYVAPTDLASVQAMVAAHHYSGGGSNTGVYFHGLFERATNRLIGVAWWLPPTRRAAESVNRADWKKVLNLTRLVCLPDAPRNACSFLQGRSIELIRRAGRFVSLVTYADESEGHTGQIYLATNWTYVGKTGPYPKWVDPKTGRQVSRQATKSRTKAQMIALGYVCTGSFFKHKFIMHLSPTRAKQMPAAAAA